MARKSKKQRRHAECYPTVKAAEEARRDRISATRKKDPAVRNRTRLFGQNGKVDPNAKHLQALIDLLVHGKDDGPNQDGGST
jgi:hypothetical protein